MDFYKWKSMVLQNPQNQHQQVSTFICICIYMLKNPWCMHPRYRPICLMYCTIIKERFCIRQGNNLTFEVFPLKSHLGKSFACLLSDGNSLMLYPIRNRCVLIGLDYLRKTSCANKIFHFQNKRMAQLGFPIKPSCANVKFYLWRHMRA